MHFHIAAYNEHFNICKLLLDLDIGDKNPEDSNGVTPLLLAQNRGHTEIAQLLEDKM